ncbi:MAG TPA: glycosyltransferase [Bacteroidia bacterium]|nr:glycosyltransferase [Bacteroidia bacterium]
MKNPHFVILTPGFCKGEEDTTAVVFLQNIIKAINRSFPEIKITIISFQYPYTSECYSWHGNRVIPLNGRSSKIKKVITWIKAWRKLKKLNKTEPISGMLCCWLTECSLMGKIFATQKNISFLCWAIGQDVKKNNRYLKFLKLRPDQIAVMGAHQKNLLAQSGLKCEMVIENGMFPEDFPDPKPGNPFSVHILGTGSLTALKNYIEFVKIIELVAKRFPDIKCEIIGEGPQRLELENAIVERKLQNCIKLSGFLPHRIVLERMYESLIFLHPSTYEGNSTVMAEAAYAGNHIVCREETAPNDSDLINTYQDIDSAAKKIIEILEQNNTKPKSELFSSIHDNAKKIVQHLGIS